MTSPPERHELADELVVVRCQLGESAAFDELVRRWSAPLYRYALKLAGEAELARDLSQDVWLRAIRGLPRLLDPAQFRPWLFGIAHRCFMDRLRSRYAIAVDNDTDPDALGALAIDADEELLHQSLERGLAALPLLEREVLTLFYLESLPLAEISTVLQIPTGTVKSRLFRARKLLRQLVVNPEQEDDR
ncbi:RNA polymerase sigma-70 factor (ECF subfamily) [Tahibacter aquaticus]|uniref:RNA polymerase sigma-70 factor (ECF subfamily) n=1 Tax=Tahibacter aquaticus TaxID=520092 RepID=A0A4R6YPQ6_9GAMM|nr:sigma-70 family RNA polymerase sigma factor [Tahibacter aquaticus]TDR39715.1 RNA polymerase sigma-70 factor (ECF subfamily) [Tahibacter aquaticus]